ncbi:MAG: hypothetical protein ACFWUL_10945 [Dialister sp.]
MGRLSALFMPNLNVLYRTFISKGELAYQYSQYTRSSIACRPLEMETLHRFSKFGLNTNSAPLNNSDAAHIHS